jgi:ligand-binding SRPBCC domain-containing protein
MKTYTLECEMLVPVSVREAFEIFKDPRNLSRITPPWLNFRITSEKVEMRQGAEIAYRIRWAGIPLAWKTRISEYEPPFFFVDVQQSGPYRHWVHRHTFRPTEGGTLVKDRVEYALPLGWLGRLAHRMVVRRQLNGIFAYRQRALMELMLSTARA